jgi:membrane protease YdiL (CAAX protease family)
MNMGVDGVFPHLHCTATDRRTGNEALELLTGWAMLEAALWTLGREQVWIGLSTIVVMAAFNLASGCTAWEQGFSLRANRRAWWMVPVAVVLAAAIVAGGAVAGTLHGLYGYRAPLWHAAGYMAWAFVQEWMALGFVFVRLERLVPRYAVLGCAAVFCAAHLPNPVLMAATFLMSAVFAMVFQRYRALYPLAFAHALFGLAVAVAMPRWMTHFMRVGMAYFK